MGKKVTESYADQVESSHSFDEMNLLTEVQQALVHEGYTTPTAIQTQMIPHVLAGEDVVGQAQTGTGKTAAFALPILSRLDVATRSPQAIVLTPTRELAIQVASNFERYGRGLHGLSVACIYGGQDYSGQLRALRRGPQVVVGTPGRTIDHIERGSLALDGIRCVVLDEADEMLKMGFVEDVEFVLSKTPESRQVCLFSATMPAAIRKIAQRHLTSPVEVCVKNRTQTATAVHQRYMKVHGRDKPTALVRMLETEDTDGVLVFARTRGATAEIAEQLARRGYLTAALNGDVAQKQRERIIESLRDGRIDIVVATDVAARGLDVKRISHVFNYDMPPDSEVYVHRIGRTGRAGRSGQALLFVTRKEQGRLRSIEKATRQTIEFQRLPTLEEVNAKRIDRFKDKVTTRLEQGEDSLFADLLIELHEASERPIEQIAAAMVEIAQDKNRLLLKEDKPRSKPERESRGKRPDRNHGPVEEGMDRFELAVGHRHRVGPGNIVGILTNEAGIKGEDIGRISIFPGYSLVDLRSTVRADALDKLKAVTVAGTSLELRRHDGASERSPRAADDGKSQRRNARESGKRASGKPHTPARPFQSRKKAKPGKKPAERSSKKKHQPAPSGKHKKKFFFGAKSRKGPSKHRSKRAATQ